MNVDYAELEIRVLLEQLKRMPKGPERDQLKSMLFGWLHGAPGRTVVHLHDEVIIEVKTEEEAKLLSEVVSQICFDTETAGPQPYADQIATMLYATYGGHMAQGDPPNDKMMVPVIPAEGWASAREFEREVLGRPAPESRDVRELRRSNRELVETNARLYDENQRMRAEVQRLRQTQMQMVQHVAVPPVGHKTWKEQYEGAKAKIKELEDKNLDLEKGRHHAYEALAYDADKVTRFLAGLDLRDHPVVEQREAQALVRQMQVTLKGPLWKR